MLDLPSPWDDKGPGRKFACREVDEELDKVAAEGWVLVGTEILTHAAKSHVRVLLATFRRGKPPRGDDTRARA